jgi:hypothetical protein
MKKKILFSSTCLLVFLKQNAQINKGSLFLGGQINFYSQNTTSSVPSVPSEKIDGVNVAPALGKAIRDNVVLGFDIDYSHSNNTQNNPEFIQTNNICGAGVF